MRHLLGALALAAAVLPAHGCTRGPRTYPVSGTVTLDGQPLPEGEILFVPVDGSTGPDPGKVKDGRFELQARAGKKRVEVSAARILPGGARGAGGEPVPEEIIPDRYNTRSVLTAEVSPEGVNRFEFPLSGGRK
jgi:hypothetical protein